MELVETMLSAAKNTRHGETRESRWHRGSRNGQNTHNWAEFGE